MKALAERYAGALVDVALENKQADQVKLELAAFAAMVRESSDLHRVLVEPLDRARQQACRNRRIGRANGREPDAAHYLFVIVDQRRAGMLPEIEQAFSALLDARQGIAQASVTSAAGIDGQRARGNGRCAGEAHREKKFKRNSKRIRRSSAAQW